MEIVVQLEARDFTPVMFFPVDFRINIDNLFCDDWILAI